MYIPSHPSLSEGGIYTITFTQCPSDSSGHPKPCVMIHAYNSSYLGGKGKRIMSLRPAWEKLARSPLKSKIKKNRRTGGMV
jgi:hypothetical protein